jgi:hypothetical protein
MAPFVSTVFPQGRTQYTPRLDVHLDNCRIQFSKAMKQFFIENQLLHLPHPPYSPDLTASDLCLFGNIKTGPADRSFLDPEGLFECFRGFLEGIPAAELTVVVDDWIDRVR